MDILFALVKVETFVTLPGNYCSQPKVDKLYRAASWMQKWNGYASHTWVN